MKEMIHMKLEINKYKITKNTDAQQKKQDIFLMKMKEE